MLRFWNPGRVLLHRVFSLLCLQRRSSIWTPRPCGSCSCGASACRCCLPLQSQGLVDIDSTWQWPATRLLAKARAATKAWMDAQRVVKAAMAAERKSGARHDEPCSEREADETCCLRAPAASDLGGQDDEAAPRRAQQLGVRELLGFARGRKGYASSNGCRARTKATSTASGAPPQSGGPVAMTSIRRSSRRSTSMLKSRRSTLQAAYTSCGSLQRDGAGRSNPEHGHAAQWSPKTSSGRRQRQASSLRLATLRAHPTAAASRHADPLSLLPFVCGPEPGCHTLTTQSAGCKEVREKN